MEFLMQCQYCGSRVEADVIRCEGCGAAQAVSAAPVAAPIASAVPTRSALKNRSVFSVIGLMFLSAGIYCLVWLVKTKNEMNASGASIPTAWLLVVPIANIWWMWKFGEGVGVVTEGKMSGPAACVLLLLSIIGIAIIQSELNKVASA
jgi:hypothetical protein